MNQPAMHPVPVLPEPLTPPDSEPTPYPVHALGDTLGPMAEALHETIKAPVAMCGQSVLMAAALTAQGFKNIHMAHGTVPLSLFSMVIAESGERKTTVDSLAMSPIKAHEKDRNEEYMAELSHFNLKKKAWNEAEKLAKKRITKNANKHEIEEVLAEAGEEPTPPILPTMTVADPTIEGIIRHFKTAMPVLGVYTSEGGVFLGGYSMGKEHVTKTIGLFSQAWDGDPLDMMRADKDTGAFRLYNRRLSISLMVQPVVAEQALADPLMTGQGFIARFLISAPERTGGSRLYQEKDIHKDPRFRAYFAKIKGLLEQGYFIQNGNELELGTLTLNARAKERWVEYHDRVERELGESGQYRHISGTAAKSAEQALRIAGVLTVIKQGTKAQFIQEAEMVAGIDLAHYSLSELLRLEAAAKIPIELSDARQLLNWIDVRGLQYIYSSQIQRIGPNQLRKKVRHGPAIDELVERGYLMPVTDPIEIDGKPRKEAWAVLHSQEPTEPQPF